MLQRGPPFEARLPNLATQEAIEELEAGGGERFTGANAALHSTLRKRKA